MASSSEVRLQLRPSLHACTMQAWASKTRPMSFEAAMFKSDPDEPVYAAAADEPADVTVAVADEPAGNAECCKKECLSRFDDEFKASLKSAMASLSRSEKRVYLFTMIDVDAEKRDLCKKTTNEKWPWCYRYTVKEYGVRRLVCRQAFATLHDTSVQVVRLLCTQMPERHLVPVEKRGKHPSSKALPVHIQELIKDHVLSVLHTPNVSLISVICLKYHCQCLFDSTLHICSLEFWILAEGFRFSN